MIFSPRHNPLARGLATLYTSTLLAGMWAMIVPAIPILAVAFEISPGTAAQIVTASGLGRFVGLPIGGAVLDRLGARSALIAGPALACIAGLVAAGIPWFGIILALVFVIGIAESVWVLAREMAGIDMARADQRGRVLSGFHGMNYIGLALGPLLGGILTENVGFRAVFIVYALCAALSVMLGLTAKGLPSSLSPPLSDRPKDSKRQTLSERLRSLKELFHQIHPELR